MDWTLPYFLLTTLLIFVGGFLQAVTGLGAGLIIVPLLAIISYALVPGPIIFASLSLSIPMFLQGRANIYYKGLAYIVFGLAMGTIIASYMLTLLPLEKLGIVFGVLVIMAVLISVKEPRVDFAPMLMFPVGGVSGFMGTVAGIGAPVLALLYQHQPGTTIRATLAFLYVFSSTIILIALHSIDRFNMQELISGFYLMPGFVLAYFFSKPFLKFIDKGYARIAVLNVSTLFAVILIFRSI